MIKKLLAPAITLVLLFTQSPAALAQAAPGLSDWATIQAIAKGKKLAIEMKNGDRIEGKLSNTSDTRLELISKNKTVGANRTEIRRIYRLSGGSRLKAALIGAGIGAGVGAGASAGYLSATGGSDFAGDFIAGATLVVAGIGAAIGAIAGGGSNRTLIYESK
ncbi:MAG: hypothetical protein ACREBD_15515 [Blastocatellia bacterium]